MDWKKLITTNPNVLHGTPCFVGTRIPISVVLDNLAANESVDFILQQYPSLNRDCILAAFAYAAELARERVVTIPNAA